MMYNPKGIPGYIYKQVFLSRYSAPRMRYETLELNEKVLTLFVHYNANNQIDDSDIEYLCQLSRISDIIFITNSVLPEIVFDEKLQLNIRCVMRRNNIGYDFGAWKDAILKYEHILRDYDRLILANNSVFFPAYNLRDVFGYMENKREIDFWGITAFTEHKYFKAPERKLFNNERIPQHIQSYFLVFKSEMFNSVFFDYWRKLAYPHTFVETVEKGELTLTKYFNEKGFDWDVLIQETKENNQFHFDGPDMTKNEPDVLLYYGSPFIKKKSLVRITEKQVNNILDILKKENPKLREYIQQQNDIKITSKYYSFLNRVCN